jgi:hypothetical protein
MLSNNHVLANSNDARVGDRILQPGPIDGAGYNIAHLERYVPISFDGEETECPFANGAAATANILSRAIGRSSRLQAVSVQTQPNYVDAAVAKPENSTMIDNTILGYEGIIQGTQEPSLGQAVRKSGRTTGCTTGEVIVVGATVKVDYGGGRMATFVDQFVTTAMSEGGDSGSIILDGNSMYVVGLLYAGSPQATIGNKIEYVIDALNIII